MRAGKLKHRIKVQKSIDSQDPISGKLIKVWTDFATLHAEVTDLSTKDQIAAKAAQSTIQARAKVRYGSKSAQIESTMRVLFDGFYYRIDGKPMRDPDSRREFLTINLATGDVSWNKG